MKIKVIILIILSQLIFLEIRSQIAFQHVSNKNIYEFIDELATNGIIEINSVIKPYSRKFIANCLAEAGEQRHKLNKRQQKDLDFYFIEFQTELDAAYEYNTKFDIFKKNKNLTALTINPLGGNYRDDLLTFAVKPIWGINYFVNDNDNIFHRWGGLEAHAYVGKNWGLYASLRDNTESKILSDPDFFTQRGGGGNFKSSESGGVDFEEMRGGIVYSWKWGSFGIIKDHVNWGNNYHGANIFNDRPPSITQLKLQMKPTDWFELNYFHGWLVSMVVDSCKSYYYNINNNSYHRPTYRPKYMAANMFTVNPWKKLNVSIGNSIVYSDMNVYPGYLIPIMFFKAIDHTVNANIDNQNSQMFFDLSSRQINNLHLYATLYVDELKTTRLFDDSTHNFWSLKMGVKEYNLFIKNLSVNFEYTKTVPLTYQHRVPTLTFESNNFNFGHYLRDNSQEYYVELKYKPLRGLHLRAYYLLSQHGPDYIYNLDGVVAVDEIPFMEEVTWQNQTISFGASYEFVSNAYLFAEYIMSDISGDEDMVERYTPEFFRGKNNTISFGFNVGF